MYVKRDYHRPFFHDKRRGMMNIWILFGFGLMLGAFAVLFTLYFNQLQLAALEAIGMAPTPTPPSQTYALRGQNLFYQGDVEGAILQFELALQQQPDNIDYLYEYGSLLLEAERVADARPVAEHALEVAPDDPRGYALMARVLMWDAPEEAIRYAIQGLDVDPNFAPLYAAQGVAYTNLGRWQEGIRNGARAVELNPNDIFVQVAYQWPLTYRGDYWGAIQALETAISLNPNLTSPYFYLASQYMNTVNLPKMAIATYERILEIDPDNAKAYLRLCQTYARVNSARFDIAQPYCDRAIELDPDYGEAYMQRGQMQYARRNYEGAIESFEICREKGSTRIECSYLRGFAHYRLGNYDEAWDILQNEARPLAIEQGGLEPILIQIDQVMDAITQRAPGYQGLAVPTAIPPTPLPPTPIGGFGT